MARTPSLSPNAEGGEKRRLAANKALVRRFVDEVRNKGRLDLIDEIVAPERVAEFRQTAAQLHAAFADYHVEIEELIAEGDKVVLRAMQRGVHRGSFLGMPATGKQVRWSIIRVFQVVDGKIADTWFASDSQALLRQLGAVILPPSEAGR